MKHKQELKDRRALMEIVQAADRVKSTKTKDIAAELKYRSEETIRGEWQLILDHLMVNSRHAAMEALREQGII